MGPSQLLGRVAVLFLHLTPASRTSSGAHQMLGAAQKLMFCEKIRFWSPSPLLSDSRGPHSCCGVHSLTQIFLPNFQGQTFKTLGFAVLPLSEPFSETQLAHIYLAERHVVRPNEWPHSSWCAVKVYKSLIRR